MAESTNNEERGIAIALLGLALALTFYVSALLRVAAMERPMLEAQLNASAQRLTATKAAQVQTEEALQKREDQLKTLSETEAKYAALLTDLIELAKTDGDARAITQKWKIQQQGQSGAATGGGDAGTLEPKAGKAAAGPASKARTP